jgi:hypothetical protein
MIFGSSSSSREFVYPFLQVHLHVQGVPLELKLWNNEDILQEKVPFPFFFSLSLCASK